MKYKNTKPAALALLAASVVPAAFAQVIDRPTNDRPDSGSSTLYIVLAVVAVLLVGAFLFFRSKKK